MSNHRAGAKISSSHTTVIDAAKIVVDAATKIPEVTKVVLGRIQRGRNSLRRLKFVEVSAGWQIDVIDNTSMQRLFVYTSAKEGTKQMLFKAWPIA